MRGKVMKNILLYLIMPEDTTEARGDVAVSPILSTRQFWLGPLKTVFWMVLAVAGPLLLLAFCA